MKLSEAGWRDCVRDDEPDDFYGDDDDFECQNCYGQGTDCDDDYRCPCREGDSADEENEGDLKEVSK